MIMATSITPNIFLATQHRFVPHHTYNKHVRYSWKRLKNLPMGHRLSTSVATCYSSESASKAAGKDYATCYSSEPTSKDVEMHQHVDGIGIIRFFRGKEVLIVGATGFLGKVFVEKILREVADVGKIYIMVKATSEEAAMQRLKSEIINDDLFKVLRKTYGESYNAYIMSKLVPVIGNIRDSDLGLQQERASQMARKVHVIVNFAADTNWGARYDGAMDINTRGPCHLIDFAKRCEQIKLYLHVSTAYVNGKRQGRIMEKPLSMGDTIAREINISGNHQPAPILDVEAELGFAFEDSYEKASFGNVSTTRKLKTTGLTRARMFGWEDTYTLTKAMGEMMIKSRRGDIPVVIVRPSIVESTLKEPFPGWIQGYRMLDPIIKNYGMGKLWGFPANPNGVVDIIPVDMVSNAILAAIARHGSMNGLEDSIAVYHVGSSVANPLRFRDFFRMLYEHFNSRPYVDPINGSIVKVSPFHIFNSVEDFSVSSSRNIIRYITGSSSLQCNENLPPEQEIILKRSVKQLESLYNIYKPYMFYGGRFDISNTKRLYDGMSEEEKERFNFDVGSIDWKDYITNVHISGIRRHVLME